MAAPCPRCRMPRRGHARDVRRRPPRGPTASPTAAQTSPATPADASTHATGMLRAIVGVDDVAVVGSRDNGVPRLRDPAQPPQERTVGNTSSVGPSGHGRSSRYAIRPSPALQSSARASRRAWRCARRGRHLGHAVVGELERRGPSRGVCGRRGHPGAPLLRARRATPAEAGGVGSDQDSNPESRATACAAECAASAPTSALAVSARPFP